MLWSQKKISEQCDNMEQEEAKVNIEETTINLACVKKELDEGEFDFYENHYKLTLTLANIFGESSHEQRDNKDGLIGFFNDEVIMESGCIKLEDIKDEEDLLQEIMEQSDLEITQCYCCKVWLGKQERLESHMEHCLKNCNRSRWSFSHLHPTDEISTRIDGTARDSTDSKIIQFKRSHEISGERDVKRQTTHSNTKEKQYKCSECPYRTNNTQHLKSHVYTHSGIKPFECDYCNKKFTQKSSLIRHIRRRHSITNEKEHKCDVCEKKYILKGDLKQHIENKHLNRSDKRHKCSECSYQTNYKGNLKVHLNTHSGTKPFECDVCKRKFTEKGSLNRHIKTQHSNTNEKEHKCDICDKKYILKGDLKQHIRNQHIKNRHSKTNEKEYKCSECPYQTNYKSDLSKHIVIHSDNKPFECNVCESKFNRKDNLKIHIKNCHSKSNEKSKEKELKCSECSYRTNNKQHLKSHVYTHSGIKPFECVVCKRKFTEKGSLNRHVKTQHGNTNDKEHKCDVCNKKYILKGDLKRHIKTRHSKSNEKEYKCSQSP